jgi:hypothetical protein
MNTIEMQDKFERLLQTTSKAYELDEKPDSETILLYLNMAQSRYIKDKYLSTESFRDRVDLVRKYEDELKKLITTTSINPATTLTTTHIPNLKRFLFPSNYLFYIRSDSNIIRNTIYPTTSSEIVPNEIVAYSNINKFITTVFNKPIIRNPLVFFEESSLQTGVNTVGVINILHDVYTTVNIMYLTYLRQPSALTLNLNSVCELAEQTHEDVVALAVNMFEQFKYKLLGSKEQKQSTE